MKIHDVTVTISAETPIYKTDPGVDFGQHRKIAFGQIGKDTIHLDLVICRQLLEPGQPLVRQRDIDGPSVDGALGVPGPPVLLQPVHHGGGVAVRE